MADGSAFNTELTPVARVEGLSRRAFDGDIRPAGKPVILKNIVQNWPSVAAGKTSFEALADHIKAFDIGASTPTFVAPPEIEGRYFYAPDMRKFNYDSREIPLRATLDKLLEQQNSPHPVGIYAGSSPTEDTLPEFGQANPMPLLDADVPPKVWISNSARVAPHFDISENIACVVSGKRRFLIFPPEQIDNLYVGPIDYNMAGQPASMVDPLNMDFQKYPKFREALAHASVAELEPGDGLYLPSLWWHFVESRGPFNVLVNYWWNGPAHGSPINVLALAILMLRDLPKNDREAWESVFRHYIFKEDAASAIDHIPESFRGVLGQSSPARDERIKTYLRAQLARVLG